MYARGYVGMDTSLGGCVWIVHTLERRSYTDVSIQCRSALIQVEIE